MSLTLNLRHLEAGEKTFEGSIEVAELAIEEVDELIHPAGPLVYRFSASLTGEGVLLEGVLRMALRCECARCLKGFDYVLELDPWSALLPLEGDDKVLVRNDCVGLTPILREDTVLAFPRHPLCGIECRGLPSRPHSPVDHPSESSAAPSGVVSPAWADLKKLKL